MCKPSPRSWTLNALRSFFDVGRYESRKTREKALYEPYSEHRASSSHSRDFPAGVRNTIAWSSNDTVTVVSANCARNTDDRWEIQSQYKTSQVPGARNVPRQDKRPSYAACEKYSPVEKSRVRVRMCSGRIARTVFEHVTHDFPAVSNISPRLHNRAPGVAGTGELWSDVERGGDGVSVHFAR